MPAASDTCLSHDWHLRLQQQAVTDHIPLSGTLELTYRCNLNCIHCYCNEPATSRGAEQELTTAEWCATIDQIADLGGLWLLFTGGECLLRPDFKELWIHAKKRGLLLTLFTNGTLITSELAQFLRDWPPYSVEVTIYGSTPATCLSVTRTPNSLAACLAGIDYLCQQGIKPKLKTMILRHNHTELNAIQSIAERLGLEFRFDAQPHARPGASPGSVESFRLSPDQVADLDRDDCIRWQAWQDFAATIVPKSGSRTLFPCSAGLSTFHITPYGSLQLCGMIPDLAWDLRNGSFHEGWHHALPQHREATVEVSQCFTCEHFDLCNQCPGWSTVEHNHLLKPVEFLCQVTKARAKLLTAS